MPRRRKQSCGNNKAAWPWTPYRPPERRHGRRHSKGQTPVHFFSLKWDFLCVCVFLNDLCFCNDYLLKNPCAQGAENLCHCSLLYSRKSVEVTTAKQGMVGSGTLGIGRGDNTSITHCQVLVSIPIARSCVLGWGHRTFRLIRLCRDDFTAFIYIPALCNKQFFSNSNSSTRRWTCIAKHGNEFGTVTWDISTGTALTTGALLTAEPTASFPKYSLMLSSFSKCHCLPHRHTHHRNAGRTSGSSASTCSGLHCWSQEFRKGTTNWKYFLADQLGNSWCEKLLTNLFHKISWIHIWHL